MNYNRRLLIALTALTTLLAAPAQIQAEQQVSSRLLLPYFEVDVDGGLTTLFAVTNASDDPADFAGIAVFLASPASDFVTGTAIPVDGGYSVMGG